MHTCRTIFILLIGFIGFIAIQQSFAADSPELDAAKYPQDTPQKALGSIIKALENDDFKYWLANLITPQESKRLIEKHGGLVKAAEANSDEKHAAKIKSQIETMKKLLAANKTTEGEEKGVKWVKFQLDDNMLLLQKETDGRWCMDPTRRKDSK